MTKTYLLLFLWALGLALSSCSKNDSKPAVEASAQIGRIAPDFTLKDVSGKDISLSSYKGKVVLLEFWATWCPPCKASVPDLIALQKKYYERGFTVLGVSMDTDSDVAAKVSRFSASHEINYPLLIANDDVPKTYHVMSIPVTFLLAKDGTIMESYVGYAGTFGEKISAEIEKLL
jgi:peroxiredoxin